MNDPDLTQLPTPSAVEPVVPLDVLQRHWNEQRVERRRHGMFVMDEPLNGMPALIERMQGVVAPSPDREFPSLGWRTLLWCALGSGVVWGFLAWVIW